MEWISVKDRLPVTGGCYLVSVVCNGADGKKFSSVSYFDVNEKEWEMMHGMSEYPTQDALFSDYSMTVISWAELPSPSND